MKSRSPRLALVLAICAALGAMGFTFGLAGVMAATSPPTDESILPEIPLPPPPPGEEEAWEHVETAWRAIREAQIEVVRRQRAPQGALSAVNVVASGALFFGALAARMRRRGGLSALRTGLVLSQAWAFLALGVRTWMQIDAVRVQREVLLPLRDVGGTAEAIANGALLTGAVTVGLTALLGLAQLAFFVWAHRWTRRDEVVTALAPMDR